jgi:hypothetical protein
MFEDAITLSFMQEKKYFTEKNDAAQRVSGA